MTSRANTVTDRSGKVIFSSGTAGVAHVMAHRALDEGRLQEGHRQLAAYLETHDGDGSEWVHVHWHMAVFELAIGRWESAHRRYMERIAPNISVAPTDAAALLWRLMLTSRREVKLPWRAVTNHARVDHTSGFVRLHAYLALAGAGDCAGLQNALDTRVDTIEQHVARIYGGGLLAFATGDFASAVSLFDRALRHIHRLGGSHAQNQLFQQIRERARRAELVGKKHAAPHDRRPFGLERLLNRPLDVAVAHRSAQSSSTSLRRSGTA